MIVEEFLSFISEYMTKEELLLAGIGLIFLVIIWVLGGKEQAMKIERKVDELRSRGYPS